MSLLARNTIFLTVAKFFSVAIYAVFGLALPVFFGDGKADEVGLYTLLSTLLFFGSMLTSFGIPVLVTRGVARDPQAAPRLLARGRLGMVLGYALSFVLLLGWLLLEAQRNDHLQADVFWAEEGRTLLLFAIVMAIVLSDAIGSLGNAIFQGYERMGFPAAIEMGTGLLRAGGAFIVLAMAPVEHKLLGIFLCFLAGAALRAIVLMRGVHRRLLPEAKKETASIREGWQMVTSSSFVALFRALRMLRNRMDVLLIGVLFVSLVPGVAEANTDVARAIYGQAMRVAIIFHTFTFAFNNALFPRIARLTGANGSRVGAKELYHRAVHWQAFWAVPLAVGVFFFSDVIAGWFGEKYLMGSVSDGVLHGTGEVLRVLLVAVLLDCLGGPVGFLMLGEKSMEKRIPLLGGMVACTNLVLNLILIPRYGLLGAAYASVMTAVVEFVVKLWIVSRFYGSPLPTIWRSIPYYLLAGVMFLGLEWSNAEDHWILGALGGALFYGVACILLRQVDPAVIHLLKNALGRSR